MMLNCKGTLKLLDPVPRHRAAYPAKWVDDMLVIDFNEEVV